MKENLLEVAKTVCFAVKQRGDLKLRNNDEEDYLRVSVEEMQSVLEKTYDLGKNDAFSEEKANRKFRREIFMKAVKELKNEPEKYLWKDGSFNVCGDTFQWMMKIYEKPDKSGIYGGKVRGLIIRREDQIVLKYDKKWYVEPEDDNTELAMEILLYMENY